jgi:pyruvate kinase
VVYTIIATLGPGSHTESTWQAMVAAGATGFRLNTSHLTLPQLHAWLERLTGFFDRQESTVPLVLDLQGSKWRLGEFPACTLAVGQTVELVYADTASSPHTLPVPHADFFRAAPLSSADIVLNDAKTRLVTESIGQNAITARVTLGGQISARKGLTYAASGYRQESLSSQDQAIVAQTQHLGFIRYALSYVKDAAEMAAYRRHFGPTAYLIAKLERQPAVDQFAQIAAWANELWLCRGDLGAELGEKSMAETVWRFSGQVKTAAIPVLLAGQVLEHMTCHPSPTRSEVCYLHDALLKGYHGVVLSDETAIGNYPVESCRAAALFAPEISSPQIKNLTIK